MSFLQRRPFGDRTLGELTFSYGGIGVILVIVAGVVYLSTR